MCVRVCVCLCACVCVDVCWCLRWRAARDGPCEPCALPAPAVCACSPLSTCARGAAMVSRGGRGVPERVRACPLSICFPLYACVRAGRVRWRLALPFRWRVALRRRPPPPPPPLLRCAGGPVPRRRVAGVGRAAGSCLARWKRRLMAKAGDTRRRGSGELLVQGAECGGPRAGASARAGSVGAAPLLCGCSVDCPLSTVRLSSASLSTFSMRGTTTPAAGTGRRSTNRPAAPTAAPALCASATPPQHGRAKPHLLALRARGLTRAFAVARCCPSLRLQPRP